MARADHACCIAAMRTDTTHSCCGDVISGKSGRVSGQMFSTLSTRQPVASSAAANRLLVEGRVNRGCRRNTPGPHPARTRPSCAGASGPGVGRSG